MGKLETVDPKKAEKKARKRAKKDAKEQKRLKKENKRLEKEAKKKSTSAAAESESDIENEAAIATPSAPVRKRIAPLSAAASSKKQKEDLKNSVYYKKRIQVAVSVLPAAMGNIHAALEDAVRLMLLKYTDNVGILLTFENLKAIGNNGGYGMILDEIPNIHFQVGFDGLVFCPKVGSKLTGKVTESFPSHLGLLVLSYVNAMIPAERLHDAGFVFDSEINEWVHESPKDDDQKVVVAKDSNVEFIVDKIHEVAGTISMEGSKPTQEEIEQEWILKGRCAAI